MKEENKLELAKLAMQMTIALLQDHQGRWQGFQTAHQLKSQDSPLKAFDVIYHHLRDTVGKE